MPGEELTRWTIRLALAAYLGRIGVELTRPPVPRRERLARGLWTLGCALLWVHVACAFQFYHDWSHAAAWEQTARETAAVTGVQSGSGVWFNYAVMLLWAGDLAWWWLAPQSFRRRPRWIEWTWQGFLAFIVFNATVVFEAGAVRWAGLAATIAIVAMAVWKVRCGRSPDRATRG